MVNVRALKAQMVLQGIRVSDVIAELKMARHTWYKRINNPENFTVGDVSKLAEILKMDVYEKERIFFGR